MDELGGSLRVLGPRVAPALSGAPRACLKKARRLPVEGKPPGGASYAERKCAEGGLRHLFVVRFCRRVVEFFTFFPNVDRGSLRHGFLSFGGRDLNFQAAYPARLMVL